MHNENMLYERMWTGYILSTLGNDYDYFKDILDTIPIKTNGDFAHLEAL
jgi:hypothetical protein